MKKLAGTGSQVSRCFDKHCQTDAIIQEVKRSKEIWILRVALILFFAYYAATKSGSELFFTYPIQQSCPAHDSSSSPSISYHTTNTSISTESPSIIPSLSQDQCSEFDSLETTSKKLEFLAEVLNWKPMKYANIVSLKYIYSYQSCKYFIGVSQTTIYKFSLYTDYTKVLSFGSVTSSSLSPDGNFMAFHENHLYLLILTTLKALLFIRSFSKLELLLLYLSSHLTRSICFMPGMTWTRCLFIIL